MVTLRLQRHGRKKSPYYHIVVADSRKKRDGRIIEDLGRYNPAMQPAMVQLDDERATYWLKVGAQPSDTVRQLLKGQGVYYRMHLERWKKSPEEIEAALAEWKAAKENKAAQTPSSVEAKKAALKAEEEVYQAEKEKRAAAAAKKAEEQRLAKEKADAEAKAAAQAEAKAAEEAEAAKETEKADDSAEASDNAAGEDEKKS
ncbi:MAG: 30S ribosomal protein S16 [Cyclonatronaceae bacterium]